MATDKETTLNETRRDQEERAKNWSQYFKDLVREWQYADKTGGRILLNKSELARIVKVSDVTIAQWLDAKKYPSRVNCMYVASAFGKSQGEVLEAAGYIGRQDDSYNTINEIMVAVRTSTEIDEAEKQRLDAALVTTITPDWIEHNPEWIELVRVVLNQKLELLEKALRIADLVDLSKAH